MAVTGVRNSYLRNSCYRGNMKMPRFAGLISIVVLLDGCANRKATPEEARTFIDNVEQKLLALNVESGRADWIKSNFITEDTETMAAKLDERTIAATVDYAKQSTRFDGLTL